MNSVSLFLVLSALGSAVAASDDSSVGGRRLRRAVVMAPWEWDAIFVEALRLDEDDCAKKYVCLVASLSEDKLVVCSFEN